MVHSQHDLRGKVRHTSVRRGDFAEALAAAAAEDVDGLHVPVPKLRYQIDPNQTLPGADVVGFLFEENSSAIEDLEFVEVKYRTSPANDLAVEAHEQLASDRESAYATTVKFLASRLLELDPDVYDAFMDFLRSRDVKDSRHTVVLAFDAENWDDEVAANLDDLDDHLPELWLRLFAFDEAVHLIDDVYAALLWEVFDDA